MFDLYGSQVQELKVTMKVWQVMEAVVLPSLMKNPLCHTWITFVTMFIA